MLFFGSAFRFLFFCSFLLFFPHHGSIPNNNKKTILQPLDSNSARWHDIDRSVPKLKILQKSNVSTIKHIFYINFFYITLLTSCIKMTKIGSRLSHSQANNRHGSIYPRDDVHKNALLSSFQTIFAVQSSLWCHLRNRPMALTRSVVGQMTSSFVLFYIPLKVTFWSENSKMLAIGEEIYFSKEYIYIFEVLGKDVVVVGQFGTCIHQITTTKLTSRFQQSWYSVTNKSHFAVYVYSNNAQLTSKFGEKYAMSCRQVL